MADTTARRVADLILHSAFEQKIEITNLKLQKLLYYCQAWYLAIQDRPLFGERIEAWVHGPVVPPVFGSLKDYRWNPIPSPGDVEERDPVVLDHVHEVLEAYGDLSGQQLEALTHREDPWRSARKGFPEDK